MMNYDSIVNQIYIIAVNEAKMQAHEYITPEHFLYASTLFDAGREILEVSGADVEQITNDLMSFFENKIEKVDSGNPTESFELLSLFNFAENYAFSANRQSISIYDLILSYFNLNESYAAYILDKNNLKRSELLKYESKKNNTVKKNDTTTHEKISKKDEEFLQKYTVELTQQAKNGELDPLIGREAILERTMQVLARRLKNNPVHVGEPGVGKTSIIEGLAQLIADGNVPAVIKNSKLFYLDMGSIIAGTKYRGDFEERFKKLFDIISNEKNPIIYIDEIHTIVGAGAISGSSMDASSILKPYLLKNNIKIIGSTTYDEYRKYFEKDRALVRRFQKIEVTEPDFKSCISILNGLKPKYEEFHNVAYTDEAIECACRLTSKYIMDKRLPDKAIDVLDEAGAFVRLKSGSEEKIIVDKAIIEKIVSDISGVKAESINTDEAEKLRNLSERLKTVVFGQEQAIDALVSAIKASRTGINDGERPVASLLFVGPTGVGKTEAARQLADCLGIKLCRFDMSEYQEKHSVARLIGAPPGYVGYEEGGLLTDAVNKTPHCVLLLDEIEKAHYDIYNILLQIMDYGRLTDNTGRQADFRNVILIMTSNAGANNIGKHIIGFDDKIMKDDAIKNELERIFSPEFRNRLDDTIIFNSVNTEMAESIAAKAIDSLNQRLRQKNVSLKAEPEVLSFLAKSGLSEKYGAREINRTIENKIKRPLVDEILFGRLAHGGYVSVILKNEELCFKIRRKKAHNP